jgi:hypothetical protein
VPGHQTQVLSPERVFFGGHLSDPDPEIAKAWLQLSYLPEWLGAPHVEQGKDGPENEFAIRVQNPEPLRASLPWADLEFRSWSGQRRSARELHIHHEASIAIEFHSPVRYTELQNHYGRTLQDLITLATGVPNAVLDVNVKPDGGGVVESQDPRGVLEVVYDRTFAPHDLPARPHPQDFLFRAADIADRLSEALAAWFEVRDALDAVLDLYFSTRYATRLFLQTRFLNVAQAVEVYHARRLSSDVIEKPAHRKRLKDILAAAPTEHRDWLVDALAYSNAKRLSARVQELLEREWLVMEPLVPDRPAFVKAVVDTRNYFTHWSKGRAIPPPAEIFILSERLAVLLQSSFLGELGFPPDRRRSIFGGNRNYIWLHGQLQSATARTKSRKHVVSTPSV